MTYLSEAELLLVRSGMRKDYILTREEKLLKQQRLEENRRISSQQMNKQVTEMEVQRNGEPSTMSTKCEPVDR